MHKKKFLKFILFTHDDLDGIGCKLIFKLAHDMIGTDEEDMEMHVCSNYSLQLAVTTYVIDAENADGETQIIFSDITPPKEVLFLLADMVRDGKLKSVMIYDHHETALFARDIIPDAVIVVENELGVKECGTSLIYKGMIDAIEKYPSKVVKFISELVDAIRSWDTYEWKTTGNVIARKLSILFNMIGEENFYWMYYNRIVFHEYDELIDPNAMIFVDAKYQCEQEIINGLSVNDVIPVNIHGRKVALMLKSVGASVSEVGNSFLEKNPEFDVFVKLSLFDEGSFSFRAVKDGINTAEEFAVPVGGGGHAKASGSPLPDFIKDALGDIVTRWLSGKDFSIELKNAADRIYVNQ